MNNQESIKIIRRHIEGQEAPFSMELPWIIIRREMICARMVTPIKWMVALRTCIPTLGNIVALGRSMAISTPRGRVGIGRVMLEGFSSRRLAFCKLVTAGTVSHGCVFRLAQRSEYERLY